MIVAEFNKLTFVVEETLSDGSKVYNVHVRPNSWDQPVVVDACDQNHAVVAARAIAYSIEVARGNFNALPWGVANASAN